MIDVAPAEAVVDEALREAYAPESTEPMHEWARSIELSAAESIEHHGAYDWEFTPWVRWIMEQVQQRTCRELFIKKSAQSGVTLGMLLIIVWLITHRPVNLLYAIDSVPEARKISKSRLQPMIKSCTGMDAVLEGLGDDDISNLFFNLPAMQLHITGAYSPGTMANKSLGAILLDELDLHPPSPQGESDTVDQARLRIKAVEQGFLIGFSKPKDWDGPTNQNYLGGTRHKMMVPCPHCGCRQELKKDGLKFGHCKDLAGEWDQARILRETYYECDCCHGRIEEQHKRAMVLAYEMVPTNVPNAAGKWPDEFHAVPGRLSLEVTDLYSQFANSTWGQIALEWVLAQGDPIKLKHFLRDRLAEATKEKKTDVSENQILAMRGGYEFGCLPPGKIAKHNQNGSLCVVMQVDVQQDLKKWTKMGFAPDGEAWLISYGSTLSFDELLAVADEDIKLGVRPDDPGPVTKVLVGFIDEGHDTMKVRDFCLRSNGRFWPVRGRGGIQVREVVDRKDDVPHEGGYVSVYHFSDDDFKKELYRYRIGEFPRIAGGVSPIKRLWFPVDIEDEFVKELCAEQMALVKVRGRMVMRWLDPKEANDYGDCVKIGLVAWYVIKPYFQPLAAAAA